MSGLRSGSCRSALHVCWRMRPTGANVCASGLGNLSLEKGTSSRLVSLLARMTASSGLPSPKSIRWTAATCAFTISLCL